VAITNAITDLPEVYKKVLIHRLFDTYIHESAPTDLRLNIEYRAGRPGPVEVAGEGPEGAGCAAG
jgi:hypothetical protein